MKPDVIVRSFVHAPCPSAVLEFGTGAHANLRAKRLIRFFFQTFSQPCVGHVVLGLNDMLCLIITLLQHCVFCVCVFHVITTLYVATVVFVLFL